MADPIDPITLRSAAAQMMQHGQIDEALGLAARAVDAAPSDPAGWVELIQGLLIARRPTDALAACAAAQRRLADNVQLMAAKARVLRSLSRVAEAGAVYRQILAIEPENVEASFGSASLLADAGAWEEAETVAADLLRAPSPSPQIDWLAARIAFGLGDLKTTIERATRALAAGSLTPDLSAETALLLGEALDRLGRRAEAFQAFSRGKAVLHTFYAGLAASREGETDKLRRLAGWFRAADPAPWRDTPRQPGVREGATHAFLVGFPRSGTTLLEQALAGHPRLTALEEPPTLAEAYDAFLTTPDGLERLARLGAKEAEHWRAVYWRVVAERGGCAEGKAFLDKAPAGTLYLPLIAKLFPDAKILFALRDPRDVVLSCFRSSFQMNALTYAFTDLEETARCYAAAMELAAVYRDVLPIAPLEIRYERLIDDFAGELERICAFLGLALDPAMLDVAATASQRVVLTPSAPQVRAGLNREGLGRWRGYAADLAPVMPVLAPWLERFGYEV